MEFKWGRNLDANALHQFAEDALHQIDEKHYDSEMQELGSSNIIKLGIAFSGKNIRIKTNTDNNEV